MTLVGTAATVVLLRDGAHGVEVLLLERPRHTGTFAGAWVFPGGRVDPEDYDAAGSVPPDLQAEPRNPEGELAAARIAGVRETAEEASLVLAPDALVDLSCWVPPLQAPKRLRTWFFLAPAPAGEIRLNPGELIDHAWLTPAEALGLHRDGNMLLVAPTFVTLTVLQQFQNTAAALAYAASAQPETYSSRLLDGYEPDAVIAWHGDDQYPAEGAGQPGSRHRLVMRGSDWRYERS